MRVTAAAVAACWLISNQQQTTQPSRSHYLSFPTALKTTINQPFKHYHEFYTLLTSLPSSTTQWLTLDAKTFPPKWLRSSRLTARRLWVSVSRRPSPAVLTE